MNKNVTLIIFAVAAIAIVGFLFLFTPKVSNSSLPINTTLSSSSSSIAITINKTEATLKKTLPSTKQLKHPPKESKKREIDPTIKAAAVDHYNAYLIQLIDENSKDQNIQPQRDPENYQYIEGKINGKHFVLRAPKAILERPNIKLKITNLKTKESKTLDASFLEEAASLPRGGQFLVNINLEHPDNIQTSIKEPEENPPFPTLNE